ncbi:MAG: GNAT family N-acetyltransferase [Jatrophihabitantaceae bacterium]
MADLALVNPVPVDDVQGWLAALATTLLGDPHDDNFPRRVEAWRREWLPERVWGARSAGRWVATLATEPRTLTVPGPDGSTLDLAADALTGVTVAATHRRRGLLTQLLTQSLADAKGRGDAVSVLIAAEWAIYGRFGYAPATRGADYRYLARPADAKVQPSGAGSVRQVEAEEIGRTGPALYDRTRRLRAGQVDRRGDWWAYRFGLDGYEPLREGKTPTHVVHDGHDGVDGFVSWTVKRDFELNGELGAIEVGELVAANGAAYRDLWAYLSGLDLIGEIELHHRPVDEPVRWLLEDGRALHQTYAGDGLWLRLLDVPAALSARSYAVSGRLVLDVVGDRLGYADGRYALDADRDGSTCTATADDADLRLSHRALAATYLGGHTLRALAPAGGVEELTAGAIARADAMFGTALAPWNATGF